MSAGETQPSAIARFTSPSSTMNNNNKKYPGTPKSPLANANTIGNRNSQTRQRLLSSKISAPRPMNLPSLRREHAVGTEVPASSPATSHGWGSSTASSPSTPFIQPTEISKPTEQPVVTSPVIKPVESTIDSPSEVDPASSPTLTSSQSSTARAWAVPTVAEPTVKPPSTDFPTAAEAAGKKNPSLYDDKEYLKYASSDPNHTSWDEMVSEDLDDFQVDVVEFDDGTKVQVDGSEESINPVSPSDRFTEDYDRSYPPRQSNESADHGYTKASYRRSEDHGYNSRYNSSVHGYDNRRHSTNVSNDERRPSTTTPTNDRWSRRESVDNNVNNNTSWSNNANRRSSHDRKSGPPPAHGNVASTSTLYHPTLLQRPRRLSEQSIKSDHSREEQLNPLQIISEPVTHEQPQEADEEICAVQREVMLSAAERAKKRRDEEEAEREAARARAKHKAELMAEQARLKAEADSKKDKSTTKEVLVKKEMPVKIEAPVIKIEKKPVFTEIEKRPKSKSPPLPSTTAAAATVATEKKKESKPTLPSKTHKPTEPVSLPDTSKPWNLVAANKDAMTDKQSTLKKEAVKQSTEPKKDIVVRTVDENGIPLTKDEQNWEVFVAAVKTNVTPPLAKTEASCSAWNSYATRLQESEIEKQALFNARHKAKNPENIVEIVDYTQNEDWGTIPSHITQGKGYDRGWTRNDEEHGGYNRGNRGGRGRGGLEHGSRSSRGRGRNSISNNSVQKQQFDVTNSGDHWRQHSGVTADGDEPKQPVVKEILKHEPAVVKAPNATKQRQEESKETKNMAITSNTCLSSPWWERSSSPIFPHAVKKLIGKKPNNMRFLLETEDSDTDITMMDRIISDSQQEVTREQHVEDADKTINEQVELSDIHEPATGAATDASHISETVDETSETSSTTSTPPRVQFPNNGPIKSDSTSPRRMNVNPNYPVLVYQYPVSQQQPQHSEDVRSKGIQQRPVGVYLMPQQQYATGNQYMIPYPQVGTGVQPVYFPALPWQQQNYNNNSASTPRPHYEQRRPYKSSDDMMNNNSEWEAISNSNGYQSHRYNNTNTSYQRGNSHRKRGAWANSTNPRGRGNYAYQPRRYPDANTLVNTQTATPEKL
ncbi:uncharacterized protein EV154DRAFT_496965 [Mucor mucedo]|uniref:uncharacterized protein n=1 Tax=Mucor mucedo TaxID=29922 RepID=UPI002220291B|nr:uncharacterized protein EV154DRAFT_496965 [Mucor mucedo]KAI7895103.1 hypothetical protein EV154DRAFT_496965 [Mucor mucedo]